MAEYRDEKETLRRRVEELEAELARLHGDGLAEAHDGLREERDELREALEGRDRALGALQRERDQLVERRDELARALADRTRPGWRAQRRHIVVALGLAGVVSLALSAYLVSLRAEAWVSGTALAMFATCLLGVLGFAFPRATADPPTPTVEERIVRSKRAEKRARRRQRQKQAVRVATEQQEITVAAKTRGGRRRGR